MCGVVIVYVLQRRNEEEDNRSNSEFTGTAETGKDCSCGVCKEARMLQSLAEVECVSVCVCASVALRAWSSFFKVSISRAFLLCSVFVGFAPSCVWHMNT